MSDLPIAMVIGYGVICLIVDSIEFRFDIALALIVIEAVYDVFMRKYKNDKSDEKQKKRKEKLKKPKDDDEYNPFK